MASKNHKMATHEPINVEALQDLASRRAAGVVCWEGSNVPIRRVILDYLAAARDGYLHPTWEEASVSFGVPTRMYAKGSASFYCLRL